MWGIPIPGQKLLGLAYRFFNKSEALTDSISQYLEETTRWTGCAILCSKCGAKGVKTAQTYVNGGFANPAFYLKGASYLLSGVGAAAQGYHLWAERNASALAFPALASGCSRAADVCEEKGNFLDCLVS
jgi:hypothetical protein